MTQAEMWTMWLQVQQGLSSIGPTIESAVASELQSLQSSMQTAMNSGNAQAFRTMFQQFFNVSITQARNVAFLRSIQPFLRPALGLAGCTWARIEICSLALTGALASEIIVSVLTVVGILIVCAIVIFLVWWLLSLLWKAWNWMPAQQPQPMQTPQWGRLFSALNDPTYGPAYGINNSMIPSSISVG